MTKYFPLGLVSISFRPHSPEEILAAMHEAGLSVIEWGSDVHAPPHDRERLLSLVDLGRKYGVSVCSYGTYFRLGATPLSELPDYIAAAKLLGTRILRLWCGSKSGADMTEEERDDLITVCREAAAIAERSDAILCMECHKGTFTERVEDSLYLMRAVSSPAFRMYYQPHQWKTQEENLAMARALAPYTEVLHVFQWKGSDRFSLADGAEEWRTYLSAFDGQPLLLEFMPDDRIESLCAEADALCRIVGGEE